MKQTGQGRQWVVWACRVRWCGVAKALLVGMSRGVRICGAWYGGNVTVFRVPYPYEACWACGVQQRSGLVSRVSQLLPATVGTPMPLEA